MGQIISRKHARSLIRAGKAWEDGIVRPDASTNVRFVAVVRSDTQRIDHYRAAASDAARLA